MVFAGRGRGTKRGPIFGKCLVRARRANGKVKEGADDYDGGRGWADNYDGGRGCSDVK